MRKGSSIDHACKVDWAKACTDPNIKSIICTSGMVGSSLCAFEPTKCLSDPVKHDPCFKDWRECLIKPEWKICDAAPKLCAIGTDMDPTPPAPGMANQRWTSPDEMDKELCGLDANKYCGGKEQIII
jgi:hypothetical protein